MAYCRYCGNQIADDAKFCTTCGASQEQDAGKTAEQSTQAEFGAATQPPRYEPLVMPASGTMKVGYLVWSILNILFCCLPFGIVGLVMTVMAPDTKSAEEETKKLKSAKAWNLAATITGGVIVFLYLLYCFIMGFMIALAAV